MSKCKHEIKSKKNILYSVVILLIILSILLPISVQNTQSTAIKIVDKNKYMAPNVEEAKTEGKVIVTYKDTEGKEIKTTDILTGKLGDVYETTRPKIQGYISNGQDPINKIGNYDDADITVNYVYEPNSGNVKTSTDGKNVLVQVIKNQQEASQEVKFSIITEDEESNKITGSKYIVSNSSSAVIRNSTAYSEKLIIGSLPIDAEGTDAYTITQLLAPKGFEKISDKINVNIEKLYDDKTQKYIITASVNNIENVRINFHEQNNEIIVTIKNKKSSEPVPDPKPIPENKKFDLQISKYITKVQAEIDGKTKIIEKDKNETGLVKVDIPKSKINKSKLEITYTIEVKNIGEVAGYVTEITDDFPDHMELVETSDWILQNNDAISSVFENIVLNPGESQTKDITLTWNLTEENIGLKTNKAIISSYYNNEGIEDETPDNTGEDSILVTVKTGGKFFIGIELVAILVLCVIFVRFKRKNNS